MYKLTIERNNEKIQYEMDNELRLDEFLVSNNYKIQRPCGGLGKCGKCRITFTQGAPVPNNYDKKKLSEYELDSGVRLSCRCMINQDVHIILPGDKSINIVEKGMLNINDISYDDSSLLDENKYGVAVDLGTTTIVAYLVNLSTGKILDAESVMNPQRAYGDDVITRCDHIAEFPDTGLNTLHDIALSAINSLIDSLCAVSKINHDDIHRFTLVGNTIMQHIILNVDPSTIAVAPFTPVFTDIKSLNASEFGLNINKDAACYVSSAVSGYVGGDTIAALKTVEMDTSEDISLLVDIGTNGEIVLGNKDRMFACSAAAGPAFEGAHIKFGLGGVSGAINKVSLVNDEIVATTIDDYNPIGICGSGLLDIIAILKQMGVLFETGALDKTKCVKHDDQIAYDIKGDVYVTQKDVREVQLAKSAIGAGINVLVNRMGIKYEDITNVYLAGGFGSHLDVVSAATIGLLPMECVDVSKSVGNAAGMGAIKLLLSDKELADSQDMKKIIEYLELSFDMEFNNLFIDHMMI